MDLRTFLFENRIGKTEFAKKLGVNRISVGAYCQGKWPQPKIAKKIEKLTEGKVTAKELLKGRPKPKVCECCGRKWQGKDMRKQPELF